VLELDVRVFGDLLPDLDLAGIDFSLLGRGYVIGSDTPIRSSWRLSDNRLFLPNNVDFFDRFGRSLHSTTRWAVSCDCVLRPRTGAD
jgi:hypothetical protein